MRMREACGGRVKPKRRRCYGCVTSRRTSTSQRGSELRRAGTGEGHPDRGPLAGGALSLYPPAVGLHQVLDDLESQPGTALIAGARGVGPVEPLEHPRQMLARDARPV